MRVVRQVLSGLPLFQPLGEMEVDRNSEAPPWPLRRLREKRVRGERVKACSRLPSADPGRAKTQGSIQRSAP
jgi:hypothetical protein